MCIPIPSFNIPLVNSLFDIYNNVVETKTFLATKEALIVLTKPYVIWVLTAFSSLSLYLIKTTNTVPVRLTKDLYYIRYFHEGKNYRIVFPVKRYNETNIVKISSSNTEEIKEYLGPNNDFHGIKVTPNEINQKDITITYFKEEDLETKTKSFSENEVIRLN
jgi:hypothetical protein